MYFVGFDPGGRQAFGWAVLEANDRSLRVIDAGTCSSAPAAVAQVSAALPATSPAGVGVDAPLFWVSEGDRQADNHVRKLVCAPDVGGKTGTVNHVNSLRGACLVQGVLVARLAHSKWPNVKVTEAHPKALMLVSTVAQTFKDSLGGTRAAECEHSRDAAIAAFSAHAFFTRRNGWINLVEKEKEVPYFPAGSEAAYWFPQGLV